MAKRRLLEFDRYRYGKRSYLYPGDRFRASGGPHFIGNDDDGKRVRIPMNEAGVCSWDPTVNHRNEHELFAFHTNGAHVSMCDGSVRFLTEDTAHRVVYSLVSRAQADNVSNEY